ncbi:hypothetical protein BDV59DRAFT_166490 [Aspergillus ambiguus]|uniref:uncharacterized protein n=1 Tax=Aspergillus ambiguus TaxID=176160 RepID=UPI003CCCEB58
MQANTQKYLGHSVESLLYKAATDPNSLIYSECRLIKDDFHIFSIKDQVKYSSDRRKWSRRRPDLQAKREQARVAVLLPEELKALQNLKRVFFTIEMAHHEANEAERRLQRPRYLPQEWIQNVIDGDNKS